MTILGLLAKSLGKAVSGFISVKRIGKAHRAITKKASKTWTSYKKKTKDITKRHVRAEEIFKRAKAEKKAATERVEESMARVGRFGATSMEVIGGSIKSTFEAFRASPVPNPVNVFYRLSDNMFKVIMSVIGIAVVLVFISLATQPDRFGDILNSFGLMFAALAAFWITMISIAVGFARFFQTDETKTTLEGITGEIKGRK